MWPGNLQYGFRVFRDSTMLESISPHVLFTLFTLSTAPSLVLIYLWPFQSLVSLSLGLIPSYYEEIAFGGECDEFDERLPRSNPSFHHSNSATAEETNHFSLSKAIHDISPKTKFVPVWVTYFSLGQSLQLGDKISRLKTSLSCYKR